MPSLVRAKDPNTGTEFTTTEGHAKRAGLTVLDKDAADKRGRPLPPKPATDLAGKPAAKQKG